MFGAVLGIETAAGADTTADPASGLSDDDQVCIGCHAADGLTTKLADGDVLSLVIDGAAFAHSVHGPMGCVSCHAQVKLPAHPGNVKTLADARTYAVARSEACRACHARVFKVYEGSAHAMALRAGMASAPTCADCHKPHQITPASVQDGAKNACVTCHGNTEEQHERWLPNAANHLAAVTCAACHAPDALSRVDLRLQVGAQPSSVRMDEAQFERRARAADVNHDGLDPKEMRALLADLERDGNEISLRGRIDLQDGVAAHELPSKARALKECIQCHDRNAAPFQHVTISVLDAEGRTLRYNAHKEILSAAITSDALRGFYAIGGTRITLLDVLLALGLVGGISVPALHLAIRRLSARNSTQDGPQP